MEGPFNKAFKKRKNKIKTGKYKKFFNINFALISRNRIVDIILSLNEQCTTKPLFSNQIFLCTEKTIWPDLLAFIFRFVLHKRAEPHFLIKVENLQFHLQTLLLAKIQELKKFNPKFQLFIVSTNPNSKIYEQFKDAREASFYYDKDCLNETEIKDILKNHRVQVVQSTVSGIGKSYYIEKMARERR